MKLFTFQSQEVLRLGHHVLSPCVNKLYLYYILYLWLMYEVFIILFILHAE